MSVARTIDLPSRQPVSSGSAERSGTAVRAVLVAAIVALATALLTGAYTYFGARTIDGYPDATPLWTD
jgi:hypothetical protein